MNFRLTGALFITQLVLFSSLNSSVCGLSCGSLASFSYVGLLASCAWKKLMHLGVKCWKWTQHMLLMCFGHGCSFQPPRRSPGGSDYNFLATSFDEFSTDWCSFHHSTGALFITQFICLWPILWLARFVLLRWIAGKLCLEKADAFGGQVLEVDTTHIYIYLFKHIVM